MKLFIFILYIPFLLLFSCASSIDVERMVHNERGAGRRGPLYGGIRVLPIEVDPPPPIIIERPIFIPEGEAVPPPAIGRLAVEAALAAGIVQPQDWRNAAMIYDFDRDLVFEVFTQPLRVTNIVLEAGEQVVDVPFISDSDRWMIGAGVSYENGIPVQHIYVRPNFASLTATLIINTDRRVYHLILRSFTNVHMPIVRWRYPERHMPQRFISDFATAGGAGGAANALGAQDPSFMADPRFLSFNYRITWGVFRRPHWVPTMVFDDGRRTYIQFPEAVLQREMPAVFENRADIVNYRVHGNFMIIDKLIERITIRLGNRVVTVEKRRG